MLVLGSDRMKKLLLSSGDIAAGKTTFSNKLSDRYKAVVFQKDTVKEILGDHIGFQNRAENKKLSVATMNILYHIFSNIAKTGSSIILESNFHEAEQEVLHAIANENGYQVLTLVLRGNTDVLYHRYLHRMNEENRHPVHLSTTLHIQSDFSKIAEQIRTGKIIGEAIEINATDFSYQDDEALFAKIDEFMN